jgi:hypothetical protein
VALDEGVFAEEGDGMQVEVERRPLDREMGAQMLEESAEAGRFGHGCERGQFDSHANHDPFHRIGRAGSDKRESEPNSDVLASLGKLADGSEPARPSVKGRGGA